MENEIANSPAARRKYIESWVDKLYDILEKKNMLHLFPEPKSQFKQYALDMFLDADASYEQIADSFGKLLEDRQKNYREKKEAETETEAEVEAENVKNEVPDNNDTSTIKDAPQDELPTKPVIEIQTNNSQIIKPVVTTTYTPVEPIVIDDRQNKVIEPVQIVEEDHSVNTELNTMFADSSKDKVDIVSTKEDSFQKQYVKNDRQKQSGVISVFNIILALLGVTTFILIALILNLLLK
ncbi:MAG: hypothetical protein IKF47_02095 [Bacilli bacterium]|nr:hypothetical protein [Bacilli bacterium]